MKTTFIQTFVLAGLAVGSLTLSSAQTPSTGFSVNVQPGPVITQGGGGPIGFEVVSGEIGVSTNVVKGAPFSLEATIESAQTLADGNRIVHRQEVRLYRDSKGRTRREEALAAIGPWSASGVPQTFITIQDPVSGANYALDPQHKTATKLPSFPNGQGFVVTGGPVGAVAVGGQRVVASGSAPVGPQTTNSSPGQISSPGPEGATVVFALSGGPQNQALQLDGKSESLGKETIAGVSADGTRITTTIPANAIGNERPLDIIREQWYSSDLQIVLRSKRTDPRFGDTAYQVTKIDRAEPAPNFFEVPSDYKVITMPTPPPPLPGQK